MIVDIAVPGDTRIKTREEDKILKYQDRKKAQSFIIHGEVVFQRRRIAEGFKTIILNLLQRN